MYTILTKGKVRDKDHFTLYHTNQYVGDYKLIYFIIFLHFGVFYSVCT